MLVDRLRNPKNDDSSRVAAIEALLRAGEPAFPIWIEKHQIDFDPPPVQEGHHRLLAFHKLGMQTVPAFLMKYAD